MQAGMHMAGNLSSVLFYDNINAGDIMMLIQDANADPWCWYWCCCWCNVSIDEDNTDATAAGNNLGEWRLLCHDHKGHNKEDGNSNDNYDDMDNNAHADIILGWS